MSSKKINFALAQIEVIPGRPDKNVAKILKETELARKRKVDAILFPEMSVGGYLLGDKWEDDSFVADLVGYNQDILAGSEGIAIFWGNIYVEFDKKGKDGRTRKYNAVYVAKDRAWVGNGVFEGHSYKTLLPEYREFHDPRHFFSMIDLADEKKVGLESLLKPFPIKIRGREVKIGAILCEDMWCQDYAVNPTEILVDNGADLIVNLSASPWTWRKNEKRHRVVKSILEENQVPFLYVNNVGIQNNGKGYFLFEGHSTVYNRDGSLVVTGSPYKEEVIDILVPSKKRVGIPLRKPYDKEDTVKLYRGLVYGLKKYFESQGFKKAVIGLSGGIDSAVDAALLSAALGPENVYAVNLPSKFNSDLTRSAASLMAKNLGIHYSVIPIQESVDLTVADLKKAGFEISSLGLENIQARDRGSRILAAVAASIGGLLINNGNKTEIGLNYCTLYGDTDGAIAPLGDIYKEEIYDLARYINKNAGRKIIPEAIINVMPSAELSAEQDVTKGKGDPIIYPIHDKYIKAFIEFRKNPEDLLRLYISGRLEAELRIPKGLIKKSFPTTKLFIEDLEKRWMALRQIFKRVQGTAIIVVSKRAFGFDLQESQPQDSVYFTRKYREMKKKLLKSG